MQQKHALVEVNLSNSCAGLIVGCEVWQLIVGSESFASMTRSHASCEVVLTLHDVMPDGIYGFDVALISRQGSHIGHASIHVASSHGMSPSLCLLHHWLVALIIDIVMIGLSTIIQEELRFVEVFLFTCEYIETCQCHLCDLVSWHYTCLISTWTYLTYHTVGKLHRYVEKLARPSGLIVRTGSIHHVPKVV